MKKLFISLFVAIGLMGLAAAQLPEKWPTPLPLDQYALTTSSYLYSDPYLDLSTLVSSEDSWGDKNLMFVCALGSELQAGTNLADYYYALNTGEDESIEGYFAAKKVGTDPLPAYPLTEMAINFLESQMKGLVISATGGIYFTEEEATSDSPATISVPTSTTAFNNITASYFAAAFPCKSDGSSIAASIMKGENAPAYFALGKDANGVFVIVQYDYLVEDNQWTFQIKCTNDNQASCIVNRLNRKTDSYRFAFGLKGETDKLLVGGNSDTDIAKIEDESKGWQITPAPSYYPSMAPALTGYKLSIAPKKALISTEASYSKVTATVLLNDKTKADFENAASVLAFVSSNNQPIIRHDNDGAEYKVGDQVAMQFPVVFHGKPTLNGNTFTFSGINLTPGSNYFLFLCFGTKNGETWEYSLEPFCISDKFSTRAIEDPISVAAGTPTGNKIPLTIKPAEGFATMVVKSSSITNIAPKGKLAVGDTYENWFTGYGAPELIGTGKVAAFLPAGTTSYELEMTPGEMTYLQLFSVVGQATDDAAYSPGMVMTPAYLQADKLPLTYTFSQKDYDPYLQSYSSMPILPPGLSTSSVLDPDSDEAEAVLSSAFSMASGLNDGEYVLLSTYYYTYPEDPMGEDDVIMDTLWPNVIFPAFSGVDKVQATFRTSYLMSQWRGVAVYTPGAGDSIRIEYSLNDGEWQQAALFTSANLPEINYGTYPLTVDFRCAKTDVVRLRYSYRTTTANVKNGIASYEFLEGRDCETPVQLSSVADGMTDQQIQLNWEDKNVRPAGQYLVSYQKYIEPVTDNEDAGGIAPWSETGEESNPEEGDTDETTDAWETFSVNTNEAVLRNLEPNTMYDIKVQAVCGAGDSSFVSLPVRLNTALGMPYTESMACGEFSWLTYTYERTPEVTTYKGIPGKELDKKDFMDEQMPAQSWSITMSQGALNDDPAPDALAVGTHLDQALLATPVIYIRKVDAFYPKTLNFRVNTYSKGFNEETYENVFSNGIDLVDPALRLYVLVSKDGSFKWDDTVASFDHTALMVQTAEGADASQEEPNETKRGKILSIDMSRFEGSVQFAFYFHNPNFLDFDDPDYDGSEPLYLELSDLSFAYDEEPCFPVVNLKAEPEQTEVLLSWEGEGVEYGISYGPADAEGYAHTIYQEATDAAVQTLKLTELTTNTEYKVAVVSYCTTGDHEHGSIERTITFTTLRQMYSVTVNITPEGAGTVTGAASYFEGSTATLTATANEGYKFTAWLEGEKELSTEATYKFQVTGDVTYTAKFEALPTYTLTLNVLPAEGGTVEGADKYYADEEVTVKATANEGFQFLAWINGNDTLSKEATYTFKMPAQDVAYTAVFVKGTANEDLLKAGFKVGTQDGRLYVRNLNGITIKDINVYGLTGNLVNRFSPNSREDLILPIDAQRAILFIRLNTEQGVAVYKVYLQ